MNLRYVVDGHDVTTVTPLPIRHARPVDLYDTHCGRCAHGVVRLRRITLLRAYRVHKAMMQSIDGGRTR